MGTHGYLVNIEQAHVVDINGSTVSGYCQMRSEKVFWPIEGASLIW